MARFISFQDKTKDVSIVFNLDLVEGVVKKGDRLTLHLSGGENIVISGCESLWWYFQQFCFDYEAQYAAYLRTSDETGVK